mmetsp:Transcript_59707/g.99182  ORF Transcript_59707/g.99182 Transcript_59707/m.99182 type:complete len:216 (-) Transcript_59707:58-705(-)
MPWFLSGEQLDKDVCSKHHFTDYFEDWSTATAGLQGKAAKQHFLGTAGSRLCTKSSFLIEPTDDNFESSASDFEAYGMPNYSRILNKDILNGWHHVQHGTSALAKHCSKNFFTLCSKTYDYVCDTTVPTLHWRRNCGVIYMLSPAEGTGCHTYKYVKGGPMPTCKPGSACDECAQPKGEVVCEVHLNGGDCEDCTPGGAAPDVSAAAAAPGISFF